MIKLSVYILRDSVPFVANRLIESLRTMNSTFCSRLLALWWHINLGRGCIFAGIPYFRKHPSGTITIRDACIFRSAEWSNSIGLNRRCFLEVGPDAEIVIGSKSGFSGSIINASSSIRIGENVLSGGNCTIVDSDRHPLDISGRRTSAPGKTEPIVIGNDVFLGMNVVVLKGVTIGEGTIVAANSVVSSSLPEKVLAGGSPARVIRSIA
ncbi:MAG TPA: acyltransferase [Nitrospirota bacterium]|nr:acyltransferase [Nitrospirota bacterium]